MLTKQLILTFEILYNKIIKFRHEIITISFRLFLVSVSFEEISKQKKFKNEKNFITAFNVDGIRFLDICANPFNLGKSD